MPSFFIVTLGCKVNQYETQALREAWLRQGFGEAETPREADVLVVNSCAITAKAVADTRATIRKLHREQPQAPVLVTGCAAEVMGHELAQIEGVSHVFSRAEKTLLLESKHLFGDDSSAANEGKNSPGSRAPQQSPLAPSQTTDTPETPLSGSLDNCLGHDYSLDNRRGIGDKSNLCDRKERDDRGNVDDLNSPASTSKDAAPAYPAFQIATYDRSRAVLKIQDGCSHCCTYCIVPRARGGSVSRPLNEALDEAGRLLQAGFAEIVISGVNLRQFHLHGRNSHTGNSEDFWLFIEALEERFAETWAGKARFRISSLEPGQLTERAVTVLGASRLVAPHLHLSLQSGSDTVLARMGRGHYTVADVRAGLEKLHAVWRPFGLGADIISGFPGETEEEHRQTVHLLSELPLTYAHVFPYSRRPHTLAARMPQQTDNQVKKRRAAELRALAKAKQQRFVETMLSIPRMQVAVEQALNAKGRAHGVNQWYVECEFIDGGGPVLTPEQRQRHTAILIDATPIATEQGRFLVQAE